MAEAIKHMGATMALPSLSRKSPLFVLFRSEVRRTPQYLGFAKLVGIDIINKLVVVRNPIAKIYHFIHLDIRYRDEIIKTLVNDKDPRGEVYVRILFINKTGEPGKRLDVTYPHEAQKTICYLAKNSQRRSHLRFLGLEPVAVLVFVESFL